MSNFAIEVQEIAKNWINETTQQHGSSALLKAKKALAMKVLTKFVHKNIPFAGRNHFEVLEYREGYIKAGAALKPNKNHFNAMYAGALYMLAEIPGGVLCLLNFDKAFYPTLAEMTMSYLKPARSDITIEFSLSQAQLSEIQAQARAEGRTEFKLEGELKDDKGEVVATSVAHYIVLHKEA